MNYHQPSTQQHSPSTSTARSTTLNSSATLSTPSHPSDTFKTSSTQPKPPPSTSSLDPPPASSPSTQPLPPLSNDHPIQITTNPSTDSIATTTPSSQPPALTPITVPRNRASSWSIFRRNSTSHDPSNPSTPTSFFLTKLTKNSSQDSPPTTSPLTDPHLPDSNFRPTHSYSGSGSFSLSSLASALKRPLNTLNLSTNSNSTPPPTGMSHHRLSPVPSPFSQSPTDSKSHQEEELSSDHITDPDPTPSVPPPPKLVVESPSQQDEPIAVPFDFNLFLDQMRWPQAQPIAKYLRSFLKEFTKRANHPTHQTSVAEQVKVINDFLDFISIKMRAIHDGPWDPQTCSDSEFDNAVEAMEKLVMNRVWHLTFTPALTKPSTLQTDDVERDVVLNQKMNLFGWLNDRHLDLSLPEDEADGFLEFAKTELLKINSYKAPRDKLICILNCCKVIFGLIRHIDQSEGGADTFIPILILVVLRAQPQNLISNVQFIQRFRNPDKLQGENGYYLSSLNAAISFIERLEHSVLSNITQTEFEFNVEQAIGRLPRSPQEPNDTSIIPKIGLPSSSSKDEILVSQSQPDRSITTGGRSSGNGGGSTSSPSIPDLTRSWFFNTVPQLAEKAVSRPLNAIAKIVDDLASESDEIRSTQRRPSLDQSRRASSSSLTDYHHYNSESLRRGSHHRHPHHHQQRERPRSADSPRSNHQDLIPIIDSSSSSIHPILSRPKTHQHQPGSESKVEYSDLNSSLRNDNNHNQSDGFSLDSQELKKIESLKRVEHQAKLETLASIFPSVEPEVLEVVLVTHRGIISKAIDSLLEMS